MRYEISAGKMKEITEGVYDNLENGVILHWGGNQAWPSQDYAIVSSEKGYENRVTYGLISLMTYKRQRVEADYIQASRTAVEHNQYFFITARTISPGDVTALVAVATDTAEAKKQEKQTAAEAFSAKVAELQNMPTNLTKAKGNTYNGCTLAAGNIKKELKAAFPKVKFSVTSERFSGGNSVSVEWTDGPTSKKVREITGKYSGGSFDGMVDLYTYSRSPWTEVFGSTKYLSETRKYSRSLLTGIVGNLRLPNVTIEESNGHAWVKCEVGGDLDQLIYREAQETEIK